MMKIQPRDKNLPAHAHYSAPRLNIFGDVTKLTAAGSKGPSEGSMTTDFTLKT